MMCRKMMMEMSLDFSVDFCVGVGVNLSSPSIELRDENKNTGIL